MKSCQDYLAELREKIHVVEDQLRSEKKNLYKANELLNDEKDKWAAEIKEEELKIHANEVQIKVKEEELEHMKVEYEQILATSARLGEENKKLKTDLQRVKKMHEDQMNKFLLEQGSLEKELAKVQDLQRDLKVSNKWAKLFQDRELKAHEAEQETQMKDELKELSDDFAKKIEAFDESLKEIDRAGLAPKRDRLAALQENLQKITNECADYEEKNKALQQQIDLLDRT